MDAAKAQLLINSLIKVGEKALPLVVPGSKPMLDLAKGILGAIDNAKLLLDAKTPPELDYIRADLAERVNAHVDSTVSTLRGNV